jgi:hypothetical protein
VWKRAAVLLTQDVLVCCVPVIPVPSRRAGVVRYATQSSTGRDGVVMRTASPSDDQRMPVDRLPPAADGQAWRGLSQSFEALPAVRTVIGQHKSLRHVRSAGSKMQFACISASYLSGGGV